MHRQCELANSASHIFRENIKKPENITMDELFKMKTPQLKEKNKYAVEKTTKLSNRLAPIRCLLPKQTKVCHCC